MKNAQRTRIILSLLAAHLLAWPVGGQTSQLSNAHWRAELNDNGTIRSLEVNRGGQTSPQWDSIAFRQDTCTGVSWYIQNGTEHQTIPLHRQADGSFSGSVKGIEYRLEYQLIDTQLAVLARIKNTTSQRLSPQRIGLTFGLSNYMAHYPQWNNIYFPTLLRCEKSHFWGYLMNPNGNLIGIASPDPIASWSLHYNFGYPSGNQQSFFWGHRVYTFNLDLINTLPLPARHPQELSSLAPGQEKRWTILLTDIKRQEEVIQTLAPLCQAPLFEIAQTTVEAGQAIEVNVVDFPNDGELLVVDPQGGSTKLYPKQGRLAYTPNAGEGLYTFTARTSQGRVSEAMVTVRQPWSWYLKQARIGALKYTQKASWNCENWYGFFSAYLAQQHFPDEQLLAQTNERFRAIIPLMYDTLSGAPTQLPNRIQNSAITIGIYVDRYKALNSLSDLETAARLADWLIGHAQSPDGAYRRGHTHYTSVIYVAKSLMELYAEEQKLGASQPLWQERYERHYASVKQAIDQLMLGQSAIDTEGELTFEDGMISCTALQIAAFALQQTNPEERKRYTETALDFLTRHNCLTQQLVPDSRQRGGTLRFWEAQYDVLMGNNMLTSPHGWTSWRTYGTYYMYLLTGEEKWLLQTMNALGSCMQVIDSHTGELRWAFVVDPYVPTVKIAGNFPNTNPDHYQNNQYKAEEGPTTPVVVGEQYVGMIADRFWGNSSDNDVHEHFKCMEEVALTSAYVVERADKSLMGYNCSVRIRNGIIEVVPAEEVVSQVHFNTRTHHKVRIHWKKQRTEYQVMSGLSWIRR